MDKVVIMLSLTFALISCKSEEESSFERLNLKFTYVNSIKFTFNENLIDIDYGGIKIKEKVSLSKNEKQTILDSYNSNSIFVFEGKEIYLYPKENIVMPTSNDIIELNHNKVITMFYIDFNLKKEVKYKSILRFNEKIKEVLRNNDDFKNSLIKLDSLKKTIKSLH